MDFTDKPRLISKREVIRRTGIKSDTIHRRMKEKAFPQSVKIGPKLVRWWENEIDQWLGSLPRGSSDFRPRQ